MMKSPGFLGLVVQVALIFPLLVMSISSNFKGPILLREKWLIIPPPNQ